MAKGIDDGTLEHSADRLRAEGFVLVVLGGAVFGGACSESLTVNCDGIVDEEFNSNGSETSGRGSASAVFGSFLCEKEWRAVDLQACDGVALVNGPKKRCAESSLVEGNGGLGVVDGEHRRN